MKLLPKMVATIGCIVAVSSAVLAQSHDQHRGGSDQGSTQRTAPNPNDAASTKEFNEAHKKMMQDMHQTFTGVTDVDFVRGMIPHHQGAIDMAKVQLKHGKDPEIRRMAEKIIADQEREIAEMQAWLRKNQK
jgi:uncharacterized protein (DUF305 family)